MINWPGLLKWSLKHSDGTIKKDFKPMDQETIKWLEEAFASVSFDYVKKMKEICNQLSEKEGIQTKEEEEETRLALLDELMELVDSLDRPNDLMKLGGLLTIFNLIMTTQYKSVRKEAAILYVQEESIRYGSILFIQEILNESDMLVKEALFSALSSVIRGENLAGKIQFIDADGVELLVQILNSPKTYSRKIRLKAALLLKDLIYYDNLLDKKLSKSNQKNDKVTQNIMLSAENHNTNLIPQSNNQLALSQPLNPIQEETKQSNNEEKDKKYSGIVSKTLSNKLELINVLNEILIEKDDTYSELRKATLELIISLCDLKKNELLHQEIVKSNIKTLANEHLNYLVNIPPNNGFHDEEIHILKTFIALI